MTSLNNANSFAENGFSDQAKGVTLDVSILETASYASWQNSIPLLNGIEIRNDSDERLADFRVEMRCEPQIARAKQWNFDFLDTGSSLEIADRRIELDAAYLSRLDEAELVQFTFELHHNNNVLCRVTREVRILARDEWGGFAVHPELLGAFVMPNDPAVATVLKEAGQILEAKGHSGSLEGYQSRDPQRVFLQTSAIWNAVCKLGLTYANPPKSFENQGQKVRRPSMIKSQGLATCLDTSLLFAAALEALNLNPAVVIAYGHAYAGVWLVEKTFSNVIETDPTEVRKAIAADEFVTFETTLVTQKPGVNFHRAVEAAEQQTQESQEHRFLGVVDIARARMARIRPLASLESEQMASVAVATETEELELTEREFDALPIEDVEQKPTTPEGRIERWQRKLLDLSLRNRLLNFRETKQAIPFLCPDVPYLEDKLADGKAIKVISLPANNPIGKRDITLHYESTGEDLNEKFASEALHHNELASPLEQGDLASRLTTLYRAARNDMAEGGSNTLFLAIGFLKWKRNADDTTTYRAPILLVPVKLQRKSALSPYRVSHHEDEVRFNSTLVQLLKKDFARDISHLDANLPKDGSGIDVPKVLKLLRKEVRNIPGFEVVDETALARFSFAKYLMWKDLVDRTSQLQENRVVRHLIQCPDKSYQPPVDSPIPEPRDIDRRYKSQELAHPLSADSSQLAATMAASEGHDFVLIGPPGTGKSQTIANIISQCLSRGQTVLFVAEKSAALDVVYRRLRQHGLGDICLELHSSKAERRQFLDQMNKSWSSGLKSRKCDWTSLNGELEERRDALNRYVEALHRVRHSGHSVYDAMGIVVKHRDLQTPSLDGYNITEVDPSGYRALQECVNRLVLTFGETNPVPALQNISHGEWTISWEQNLLSAAGELQAVALKFQETVACFRDKLGLGTSEEWKLKETSILKRLAALLPTVAEENYRISYEKEFPLLQKQFQKIAKTIEAYRKARSELNATYDESQLAKIPIEELDLDWRKATSKIWPLSFFSKGKVRKFLQTYAESGTVDPDTDIAKLRQLQQLLPELEDAELVNRLPGWNGIETDLSSQRGFLDRAADVRKAIREIGKQLGALEEVSRNVASVVATQNASGPLLDIAARFYEDCETFEQTRTQFVALAGKNDACLKNAMTLSDIAAVATDIQQHQKELRRWTTWVQTREQAITLGLTPYVEALQSGSLPASHLPTAFEVAFARAFLKKHFDSEEALRSFQSYTHEDVIEKFKGLDSVARQTAAEHILLSMRHGIRKDLPKQDKVARKSELGLLQHQMHLKRPSKSIREVISAMPDEFRKLAPCVLMSPLSIAQYLPADLPPFDVVIFDEASQITTWDAIGAIGRGRQTIIVGDPKQLPPTNFFGRAESDEDDDTEDFEKDMESILDEAAAASLPRFHLNWHYRSRHESLIAFSNWKYYDNKLVTFPSTETRDRAVSLVHLPQAVYDKGKSRTNRQEAERIVRDAVSLMKESLDLPEFERPSLGIITFNSQQQTLIQDLLDAQLRDHPELEWYFADNRIEPTVVKNLENVQGDERDVIFFSITYGPDRTQRETGTVGANFGPLNRQGGERRLNVAVTRARQQLTVYVSFLPDQLQVAKTKYDGVRHLKLFLEFAERGPAILEAETKGSLGGYESPFEEAVACGLHDLGWQVVPQVGVSSFRIDLGIVHPDFPEVFLAGVECDGATYHRSATARDRDLVREEVLRGLGWQILRIWSPDWWYDTEKELETLHSKLNELLERDREQRALPESNDEPRHRAIKTTYSPQEVDYEFADLAINADTFFDSEYSDIIREVVQRILDAEAPLKSERVSQLVARVHGWKRTGRRIQERVESILKEFPRSEESIGVFIWKEEPIPEAIELRTHGHFGDRNIQDIPLAELTGFLQTRPDLMDEEDPAAALGRELNIARLAANARKRLQKAIHAASR